MYGLIDNRGSQFAIVLRAFGGVGKKLVGLNNQRSPAGVRRALVRVVTLNQAFVRRPDHLGAGLRAHLQYFVMVHGSVRSVGSRTKLVIELSRSLSLNSCGVTDTTAFG